MRRALSSAPAQTDACDLPDDIVGPTFIGADDDESARVQDFAEGTAELRERAGSISENGATRWLARYAGDWGRYELAIVTSAYEAPRLDALTYVAGSIQGRAVLWDHQAGRPICARDVDITPGDDFEVTVAADTSGDAVASRVAAYHSVVRHFREVVLARSKAALRGP